MNRRCVIFAGLAVPPHLCQDIGPQDVILAADAGWKTARALGFAPTLALGDFDTAPAPKGPDVLRLPAEKDDTDTFFAARKALEMGCSEVLILGGIGGRLDHTLANICTLLFLEQHGVRAWLRSETALVRVLLPGQYKFPAQKDVYVSLFPMCGAVHGLCLRGFRYPLENAVLEPASTLGTSNEFAAQAGHVSFSQGTLIYSRGQSRPRAALFLPAMRNIFARRGIRYSRPGAQGACPCAGKQPQRAHRRGKRRADYCVEKPKAPVRAAARHF